MTLRLRIQSDAAAELPVLVPGNELFDEVERTVGELQGQEASALIEALTSWLDVVQPAA